VSADPHNKLDERAVLEVSGRWLQALTDGSGEIVSLVGEDGRIQFMSMSGTVEALLGYDAVELSSQIHQRLLHPDDASMVVAAFEELARTPGARKTIEYRFRHRSSHYVRLRSTAVNRLDDPIVGAVVVHTCEAHPSSPPPSSSLDPTTRIRERDAFLEAVTVAVDRALVNNNYAFSLLIIELDRLKMVATSYGQEVVNALLAEVARRLIRLLRPEDTLGQLEGGEFAILLDGARDPQAARVADQIQKSIGQKCNIGGQTIATSAIVGIATSKRRYDRAESVMRDAALAATRARRHGRRRRAVFQTQMRIEDTRYMSLVTGLHNALQKDQLLVYYQPIVSLATHTLSGFEALVRWDHPDQGLIPPGHFIPVAEDTGLIVQLGQYVLNEACRQMADWHRTYATDPPLHVSINLSTKQFVDDDLFVQVEQALASTGLDAHQLKLEITESAVLENREAAMVALTKLKKHGVRVSLDDFGTGYSSFSYLYQLPYDTLKIDRSFITRIGDDGENSEIIHAIIVLAHNLRMDVVAEGVETPSQAAQLKNMWCEYAQGYFFARPMDGKSAGELIASCPQW